MVDGMLVVMLLGSILMTPVLSLLGLMLWKIAFSTGTFPFSCSRAFSGSLLL